MAQSPAKRCATAVPRAWVSCTNDGERRTASTLTYVSACPASLISQEIPSRRIRIRITGSETTSQVCAALTMTGKHFLSVPSTFKDTIQLNPTLAVFQEANPLVSALKTSKSWRMRSECRDPAFRGFADGLIVRIATGCAKSRMVSGCCLSSSPT